MTEVASLPAVDRIPRILLVSSWQTVNIGDVAHSPGALRALQRFLGEVELTLWAKSLGPREREMFAEHFPDVTVVEERLAPDGRPSAELLRLFEGCDLMLHGSGPLMVARRELAAWRAHTDKPYGIFGVTFDPLMPHYGTLSQVSAMVDGITGPVLDAEERDILAGASFVFCRETLSTRFLRGQGIEKATFGPDAALCFDLQDEPAGAKVLEQFGLADRPFTCVIPRLRFTPYHRLHRTADLTGDAVGRPVSPEDVRRDAVNAAYEKADMDVLREIVVEHVRRTDEHVLVVPEMSYQMDLAVTHFGSSLPADVADRVHVLTHFWSLTEAAAVYRRATALVSIECHSPLIALAVDVPAIYVRQPTDTIKGHMYVDLGLDDRVFDIGSQTAADVLHQLKVIVHDRAAAREATARVRVAAEAEIQRMVATVRSFVSEPDGSAPDRDTRD